MRINLLTRGTTQSCTAEQPPPLREPRARRGDPAERTQCPETNLEGAVGAAYCAPTAQHGAVHSTGEQIQHKRKRLGRQERLLPREHGTLFYRKRSFLSRKNAL